MDSYNMDSYFVIIRYPFLYSLSPREYILISSGLSPVMKPEYLAQYWFGLYILTLFDKA